MDKRRQARHQSGISYVELLVAVVIIAISVGPISSALQTSMQVASADLNATANHYQLVSKLESVLAESFSSLSAATLGATTPSSYSDAVATPNRQLVYIAEYDADNADTDNNPFTGVEADMLWIRVEVEGYPQQSLTSLKYSR